MKLDIKCSVGKNADGGGRGILEGTRYPIG
jgi:hypothetical protein